MILTNGSMSFGKNISTNKNSEKGLSERDICTKFIAPAITAAGWDLHTQIREEVTLIESALQAA
jgi:type I site-specific restriction endonuclease